MTRPALPTCTAFGVPEDPEVNIAYTGSSGATGGSGRNGPPADLGTRTTATPSRSGCQPSATTQHTGRTRSIIARTRAGGSSVATGT